MIDVVDNFLEFRQYQEIKETVSSGQFPWFWMKNVVPNSGIEETFNSFFIHSFYQSGSTTSSYMPCLNPLLSKLNILSLIMARANLYTPTENLIVHGFHVDFYDYNEETLSKITTCVYYLDDSDGKTVFEDGTEIHSKGNRIALFPANIKHSSTNCTNTKTRLVINLNYISK